MLTTEQYTSWQELLQDALQLPQGARTDSLLARDLDTLRKRAEWITKPHDYDIAGEDDEQRAAELAAAKLLALINSLKNAPESVLSSDITALTEHITAWARKQGVMKVRLFE